MRKLKFRAWNGYRILKDKELRENAELLYTKAGSSDQYMYDILLPNSKDLILMQYTGLKDRNGKDVYEGDILSYKHIAYTDCSKTRIEEIEEESFIEIITYAPMASIVKPHSKNVRCLGYDSVNKECLILDLTSDEVEIIGNIYENPELLE